MALKDQSRVCVAFGINTTAYNRPAAIPRMTMGVNFRRFAAVRLSIRTNLRSVGKDAQATDQAT
jgi:hypothetical protein